MNRMIAANLTVACALLILGSTAPLVSCQTTNWLLDDTVPKGRDFDLAAARAIQDGVTTKGEIERVFGRPGEVTALGGSETWTFQYQRVSQGRRKTWGAGTLNQHTTQTETSVRYRKALVVTFNPQDIVTSHLVNEAGSRGGA